MVGLTSVGVWIPRIRHEEAPNPNALLVVEKPFLLEVFYYTRGIASALISNSPKSGSFGNSAKTAAVPYIRWLECDRYAGGYYAVQSVEYATDRESEVCIRSWSVPTAALKRASGPGL